MKERRREIEDEVTRLEVEIADYEAGLANFVSVEETRAPDRLCWRPAAPTWSRLMAEWEEVAQTMEANS